MDAAGDRPAAALRRNRASWSRRRGIGQFLDENLFKNPAAARASKAWIPELIASAGPEVTETYIDFFTATIRNRNTRAAYARACWQFFDWCAAHGLELTTVRPFHVAAWIEDFPGPNRPLSKSSLRCGCCTIFWSFGKSHHRIRHIPFAVQSMW